MIEEGELARFIGSLEHDGVQPECRSEPVGIRPAEISPVVEESDAEGTFPRFDNELEGARVEPLLPLIDESIYRFFRECAVMFLPQLELDLQAPLLSHAHHL